MIILTFGLLSPNKGIETMLDAMPEYHQNPAQTPFMSFLALLIRTLVRATGRGVSREFDGTRAGASALETMSSFSTSSWTEATLLGLHFNVRRLYDSLSQ